MRIYHFHENDKNCFEIPENKSFRFIIRLFKTIPLGYQLLPN